MEIKEKEIHLKDYFKVVKKRKKTIFMFFIITTAAVVLGTLNSTPLYKSSIKVKIEKNISDPLKSSLRYMTYDPDFIETQTQIIMSPAVALKVVKNLNLVENYKLFFPEEKKDNKPSIIKEIKKSIKTLLSTLIKKKEKKEEAPKQAGLNFAGDISENSPESSMAAMIAGGLNVAPMPQSKIISISFVSENPTFSTLVVNNIAKAYIERLLEMKMENIEYTLEWMRKKAGEERKKLEKSEKKLQEYLRKKNIVTIEDRITIIPQRLSEISSKLTMAETKRKEVEAILNQIKKTKPSERESIPIIAASKELQNIRSSILRTEQKRFELSQKYGPKHPVILRVNQELATLNELKMKEITTIVAKVNNDYMLAVSNEQNLKEQLKLTKDEASTLNEKFVQYQILKREVDINRNIYQALIGRIKEQTITKQTRDIDVWLVEKANLPKMPFNQNAKKKILLAIVLGLFGGIGLAFFLEYIDDTVSMPEDAEEKTGLPALGLIERMDKKDGTIEKIVNEKPLSPPAEAYKGIRASLALSTAKGFPSSFVITSASPGEGKSITASNLAIAIAAVGKKVLLIDADMRRPKIHESFNLNNELGFSSLLSGSKQDSGLIKQSEIKNLWIITSGPIPPNPSELIASGLTKELMQKLNSKFDIIIFDSPPAGRVADAIILASVAEKTVLVSMSGVTKYEDITGILKKFSGLESKILGNIINSVDLKKEGYSNSYYMSYSGYSYSQS